MHDSNPLKARRKLNRLIDLLSAFQENMLSLLQREVERHELTLPQHFVLTLIAEGSEGICPSHISRSMMHTSATTTGLTDKLIARGYITRSPSTKDRRGITLRLSDKGRQVLEEIRSAQTANILKLSSKLEEEERKLWIGISTKIQSQQNQKPPLFLRVRKYLSALSCKFAVTFESLEGCAALAAM